MRRWSITLGFMLLCGSLLWVLVKNFGRDPHEVPFMLRGKPAPEFTLKQLDTGDRVALAQLKGRPLVINFWASWCGPCRQEHAIIEWGSREFSDQARFLGVVFEDTEENAKAAIAEHGGSNLPQMIDGLGQMAVDYGVTGVPETYFIDASGIIRDKFIGPIDPQSLKSHLQALVQPAPTAEAKQ